MGKAFDPAECRCLACIDLAAEAGGYGAARRVSQLLRRRGWAGSYDPAELAFLRAHPPRWWQQTAEAGGEARQRALRALVWGQTA